ncbi:hypothetical protein [Vibrio sp. 1569]|uniref:hypothetical protein n=1 Tax=Vibrio sp. 1569 TaxID=3074565 RepID=UPI002964E32F|nr:hypothetical protein [Vibrio sp. 1569]MDW2252109.1 hypothetical protein [Vibrio sp. 1569]
MPLQHDILVLNWFEERASNSQFPLVEFIRTVLMLLIFRFKFKKIIYVAHNVYPHSGKAIIAFKLLKKIIRYVSDKTVIHRDNVNLDSEYIPHPLYDVSPGSKHVREIDFLFFGQIKPYKGIESLLLAWPKSYKLNLLGACLEPSLKSRIDHIVSSRDLSVEWCDKFVSIEYLNEQISNAKYIVLPHSNDSMYVSGSFFHAISRGTNILMKKSEFSDYCQEKFSFVYVYEDQSLVTVIDNLIEIDSGLILNEAELECGLKAQTKYWSSIFS